MAEARHRSIAIIVLIALFAVVGVAASFLPRSAGATKEVRWLLTHQPTDVFTRASGVFAQELAKESNGSLALKVITPADLGYADKGDLSHADVLAILKDGKAELASVYTTALAKSDIAFNAVAAPFRFATYDELPAVLDGEEGEVILKTLDSQGIHGLVFTLSGGFYVIASKNKQIHSLSDLKGMRIATAGGDMEQAALKAFGAVPVPTDLGSAPVSGDIDAVETTYSRLSTVVEKGSPYLANINETNHALFSTVIVAGEEFYTSLTPKEQQALTQAAKKAALVEREDSIALNAATREDLIKQGSTIVEMTDALKASLTQLTKDLRPNL